MPTKSATIADLHLRTYTWASRPRILGDATHAMTYFFDYCLNNDCSAKLLGDIFHTLTPLPEFVKPLFDKITEMQEKELPVYYIQGNHDLNKVPWLSLHPWPINLNKQVVELPEAGMTVLGQQSTNHDELIKVFEDLPENVDTLLLHQAEVKAMPFSFEFVLEDIPQQIKNVLIGHIHNPQDYNHGATHLWYPGSPYVTDISNIEPRSFLVESVEAGETIIRREVIPGRGFYKLQITGDQDQDLIDAEEIINEIAEIDPRYNDFEPIVIIEYPPALAEKAHQRFLALREPLKIYTWLGVTGELGDGLGGPDDAPGALEGDANITEIINENVAQEVPREILTKIFQGNDTGEVLRAGLEEIL